MPEARVTILHVDDNEANRYVVARILQNAGFSVVEAATGATGLEAITDHQPALVILDVRLPDLGGFEVCRQIKTNPETASIPVLHLSASFIKSRDKAEGLDSGADAYLAQPVDPIELLATVRSLLRIRRAEEAALSLAQEWQITFNSINDGVCLVDQDGKFIRCNRAMSQLFCKPTHEILGCAHHELLNAELGIGDGTCFRRAQATHQRQVEEIQAQGRWFTKTIDPVLDQQGTFTGSVFILADITNRKQSEALLQNQNDRLNQLMLSLQQQTEEAQQANRIKDEFLAVLSHELRSPLNPILGWTKILQTSSQDKARTQYALETIERNAKLQAQLIEDLLDVSRILQGKLSLNTDQIDLAFTVKAALETVTLAAEAKSIQIQAVLEPNVGPVLGDSNRLQQVVWNLLTNAVKFTPKNGRVEVRLKKSECSNSASERLDLTQNSQTYAQITVTDTGRGISPDFLPYVFDYFRQADSTTTRKFGGLGLGLAIVHQLVELHGGTIQASSPGEGQGAIFTVSLPLITATKLNQNQTLFQGSLATNLSELQILVVDDDRDSRELVAFLLRQQGAIVTEAESAREALNYLKQTEFNLLVSDIGMPDLDGYALIRQIRSRSINQNSAIPAIALTAYAGEIDQKQALAVGFQQHLTKPIEPEMLVQMVQTLVEKTLVETNTAPFSAAE